MLFGYTLRFVTAMFVTAQILSFRQVAQHPKNFHTITHNNNNIIGSISSFRNLRHYSSTGFYFKSKVIEGSHEGKKCFFNFWVLFFKIYIEFPFKRKILFGYALRFVTAMFVTVQITSFRQVAQFSFLLVSSSTKLILTLLKLLLSLIKFEIS